MAFEYANRLARDGYHVQILFINEQALKRFHLPKSVRYKLSNIVTKFEPRWFKLDPSIQKISSNSRLFPNTIINTDVVIATAVQSIEYIQKYFTNSRKIYYIQDYENWNCSDSYVRSTYALGYTNIVISEWLKDIVDKYAQQPSILINNPIDLNIYKIMKPVQNRDMHTISLLYHVKEHKGVKYALDAINRLHDIYSDLEVYMFGAFDFWNDEPWIHYTRRASQLQTVEIYNKTRVFLCATVEEGFGLTGLEAMACGNVLVSTNYQGVREYAKDGYNALLSPVKDVDALVENVKRAFEDEELSNRLVANGQESVKQFSWEEAYQKFKKAILG